MISKRRRLGNDGHNMYVMTKTSSGTKESDSYEKDIRLAKRAVDSGMTKKRISTRRSFDNSRMRRALMDAYRRYVLFDAEESDTEAFRHNGTVKVLSEEEKKEYIKKRNIERILEMRRNK